MSVGYQDGHCYQPSGRITRNLRFIDFVDLFLVEILLGVAPVDFLAYKNVPPNSCIRQACRAAQKFYASPMPVRRDSKTCPEPRSPSRKTTLYPAFLQLNVSQVKRQESARAGRCPRPAGRRQRPFCRRPAWRAAPRCGRLGRSPGSWSGRLRRFRRFFP